MKNLAISNVIQKLQVTITYFLKYILTVMLEFMHERFHMNPPYLGSLQTSSVHPALNKHPTVQTAV